MTKQAIIDKILEIICSKLNIEKKEITAESSFNSFGTNAFDVIEIIIDIEKDFKIIIPRNIALNFYAITSTSIVDYITSVADYIDIVINIKN
mgnify:CR=1 FL=1